MSRVTSDVIKLTKNYGENPAKVVSRFYALVGIPDRYYETNSKLFKSSNSMIMLSFMASAIDWSSSWLIMSSVIMS